MSSLLRMNYNFKGNMSDGVSFKNTAFQISCEKGNLDKNDSKAKVFHAKYSEFSCADKL
jgi:hypothetical protein